MQVQILGTRGIPSRHGGFETFAEDLALYLRKQDHDVTVYCQHNTSRATTEEWWNGIRLVHMYGGEGAWGTIVYDWAVIRHAVRQPGVVLTLGYNTAIFNLLHRLKGIPSAMNMDGIEWRRDKWSTLQRVWLWLNERAGACVSHRLIADHPEIAHHLSRHTSPEKITVIPYGANAVLSAAEELLEPFGLQRKGYYILIARPEPENSVLEVVQGYSQQRHGVPLIVLGHYAPESNDYQRQVMEAAGKEVRFVGSIYDRQVVQALRFHARAYFHGHTVGGTNPSLVESLAAGNAILAHDNRFNRWVAGEAALYFHNADEFAARLQLLQDDPTRLATLEQQSRQRHSAAFTQEIILPAYERVLLELSQSRS
jgi:glycosyltransferase involved in cell wall biosynthesis